MLNSIKSNFNQISKIAFETKAKEKLISELNQFGLCPYDWTIESKNNDQIIIKNMSDENFKFAGKIDSKLSQWKSLTLISL